MGLRNRLFSAVAFLRAGYPTPAPHVGYAPLLALLPRRVSDDEIVAIARRLLSASRHAIDDIDAGVEIIAATDEMPCADDIERVMVAVQAARHRG